MALQKTLMNVGYALIQPSFQHYRNEIKFSNSDAGRLVYNLLVEKWTMSYDNGQRWGHMTTNLIESMNDVIKGIRNLPTIALVKSTYFRMASLFAKRGEKCSAVLQSGQLWGESYMKFIKTESAKVNSHHVTRFSRHNHKFTVKETIDHNEGLPRHEYWVLLPSRWCDCRKFQALCMTCSHVIAACSYAHRDALSLLSPAYKIDTLLNIYNNGFSVVAKEDYWSVYEGKIV